MSLSTGQELTGKEQGTSTQSMIPEISFVDGRLIDFNLWSLVLL